MPRQPMPDIVVLLPGITGSVLKKEGKVVWGFSGRSLAGSLFTRGRSLRRALTLGEDPPDRDDLEDGVVADALIPDLHLLPRLWKIDGYSKVADTILSRFDVTEGENFFRFPYDWRRDNRVAARRLARESHAWLKRWRETKNPDAKLILVAHSMGGLVSRYFLEVLEGWKDTRALVSFGTPYRGSLNALDTLANGMRKGPFGFMDLSELGRSLTSIYQLLPIYKCYDAGSGQMVRVGETDGIPNVDAARAKAALDFHREIEDAVNTNLQNDAYVDGGYRIYPVVGIAQDTNQSGRLGDNGVDLLKTYDGTDYKGDGTVPRVSATPIEYSDEGRDMFAATKHGSLQNADAVLTHLDGLINSLYFDLGGFRKPQLSPVKLAIEVEDLYWLGEPIIVRVRPEREDVRLVATLMRSNPGDAVGTIPLHDDGDGWKVAEFAPPAEGSYRIEVSGGAEVEPAADALAVAGIGPEETMRGSSEGAPPMGTAPPIDLGTTRSGRRTRGGRGPTDRPDSGSDAPEATAGTDEEPEKIDVSISAETPGEVQAGEVELVDFRIELVGEARPLRHRVEGPVEVRPDQKIRVLLSTYGDAIAPLGSRIQEVEPPVAGRPALGAFEIQAHTPGTAEIALLFRQGGTQLGSVHFSISVVAAAPRAEPARAQVLAEPRDGADDEILVLLIEQRKEGDQIRYEYRLHSEALGLNYLSLNSAPLKDRGGGSTATTQAYVEWIYDRVGDEVRNWNDATRLARGLRTLGMDMCEQLFDPDVTRRLWDARDRLRMVQVTSWEPYIPWEILRLRDPDTGDADERFLCEYGLVRSLPGEAQPRSLEIRQWSFLAARYPNGLEAPVGSEVAYFTETLPARGVQPVEISPAYDPFFAAIEAGEFDVLHLACHGESQHDQIDNSVLIIGDEVGPDGKARPIEVDEKTVRHDARLKGRRPIVFLNACASARHGASLTAWGGWPTAFLKAGAGVFVGTSWPVREKPAAKFAETFYDTLQDGKMLAEAAAAARDATKGMGDGSWLAFKVYGHPRARMMQ